MSIIKCKAAVLWGPNEKFSLEKIEVAPPKSGEIRLEMLKTSPCHTDVTAITGKGIGPCGRLFPVILGHEAVAIVESVGDGVNSFRIGDKVIPIAMPQCNKCDSCLNPSDNNCSAISASHAAGLMPDMTSRFTCKGQVIYHYLGCSTFSEYTVVSEHSLCKVSPEVPVDVASLFGCCFTTGYGSVVNLARVAPNSVCAVWGIGAVGLSAVIGLMSSGAKTIIAIDTNPYKFEIAKKLGATHFFNPKEDNVLECIEKLTDSKGCDFTFECVGSIQAMEDALMASNSGHGIFVMVGAVAGGENIVFNPFHILSGRTMRGGIVGGVKMKDWVPKMTEKFLSEKYFPMATLITHKLSFSEIQRAIELMGNNAVRVSLSF